MVPRQREARRRLQEGGRRRGGARAGAQQWREHLRALSIHPLALQVWPDTRGGQCSPESRLSNAIQDVVWDDSNCFSFVGMSQACLGSQARPGRAVLKPLLVRSMQPGRGACVSLCAGADKDRELVWRAARGGPSRNLCRPGSLPGGSRQVRERRLLGHPVLCTHGA